MSENLCFTYAVHFSSGFWWKGKSSYMSSLRTWSENCYHHLLSQILWSAQISIPANFSTSCSTILFMPNSIFFYPLNTLSIFQLWGLCTYSFFCQEYSSQSSFSSNVTFSEGLCWPMSYSHPSASQSTIWTILHPHWLHHNLILPCILAYMLTVLLFPTKMDVPYNKIHDCLTYQVTLRSRTVWQMLKKYFWVISKWINVGRHIKKKTNSGIMLWWDLVENQSQEQGTLTLLGI